MSVFFMAVSVFGIAGCKKENPAKTLYIEIENAGFGIAWIDPLIEIFEAEHPGITVKKTFITKGGSQMLDKVVSGNSHLDLLFVEHSKALYVAGKQIVANGVTYDSPFADLGDIYEANVPGENIKLKDKMLPAYYGQKTILVNGEKKQYVMPWMQALTGMVINNKVYKPEYGKLPNTTDEMFAFFENLPSNVTPYIYAISDSYWDDVSTIWMAQYNGSENMKKFYQAYALYVEGNPRYVPEMMLDEGIYEMLKVMERLLNPSNGYSHPLSQTLDFTSVQNVFLEGKDNILFMPNGSWLEREMEANFSPDELDIEFIKTPVISALGKKLGITDAELSAIIDYVDGTVTQVPNFNPTKFYTKEEVIAAVKDAREMLPANYDFAAVIPAYSSKIDLAKEFLQLIASDRGIEAMLKKCGSMAPFKYDIQNSPVKDHLSPFMYKANLMIQTGKYTFSEMDNVFIKGGLRIYNNINSVSVLLGATNAKDRKTAEQIYADNYNYVKSMWPTILRNAGITL